MVHFEFSFLVAVTLFYVMLQSYGVSSGTKDPCLRVSTPYDMENKLLLKSHESKIAAPYHLPECDEKPMNIKHGKILPLFHIKYTVTCDEYHILPLGSKNSWECLSPSLTTNENHLAEVVQKHLRVSECADKKLPVEIYVQRGVNVHNAKGCQNGLPGYMAEEGKLLNQAKTFLIQGLKFVLMFTPEKSECTITVNNLSHVILGWIAHLKFRLVHIPAHIRFSDSVFDESNCLLETAIKEKMDENMKTNPDATYELGEPETMFHAGRCLDDGYIIDVKHKGVFKNDVPLCQTCMRGYYLDKGKMACRVCEQNHYSGILGATSCRPCPTMHNKTMSHRGDSIMDCYDWVSKSNREAVIRGIIFVVVFHVTYVAILTWNIRSYIRENLMKTARRDDDQISN